MSGTQRAIVELGGENYPLLLKDVESLSFDSLVDAIRKKVSPKEIPQSAVFACVDNTGRVVRIKDDEDVSYFLAVARLLEDKGRQAVLTVRIKTPGAPTPPPDLSAGPRARLREASNSPSPRGSPTPAYVPSYRDPGDEGGNIHFDPSSDRVVVLYDGHGEPEGEISPFTPHPPSPMKAEGHAGDEEGWEDEEEGGGEGKGDGAGRTTSDNAKDGAAQGTRGKGKGRRGGARADAPGQGHKDAAEPKKPQAGHDEKHAVAQPAPRPAKLSKIPEIIPDGENGWGGSGYDEAPAPAARPPNSGPPKKPKERAPPKQPAPAPAPASSTRRIVVPPPEDQPAKVPTAPVHSPKLTRREVDELMAERRRQAQLLEERHALVERDKAEALARERAHTERQKEAAAEADRRKKEEEARRKESLREWEEQEAERRKNMERKLQKMELREWDLDKKKETPPASPRGSAEQRGGARGARGRGGPPSKAGPSGGRPAARPGQDPNWEPPSAEGAKPLVDEGWK